MAVKKKSTKKPGTKPKSESKPKSDPKPKMETEPEREPEPEELILERDKLNLVTIYFTNEVFVRVYPGRNRWTEDKEPDLFECIKNEKLNKSWLKFIDQGIHKIITGTEEKTGEKTNVFTAMASDDSIQTVKNTFSIPALEQMYNDEQSKKSRTNVLNAIEDQIKEIKTPDKK